VDGEESEYDEEEEGESYYDEEDDEAEATSKMEAVTEVKTEATPAEE